MKLSTFNLLVAAVLVSSLVCSFNANAGGLIYGGANLGYAELDSSDTTTYGLHVGTGIFPVVGIEAGYWDFGNMKNADYTSYYFAAKPSITLGAFQLFAKGGIALYDKDSSTGKSDDGVDLMYGLGAEYYISRMISVGGSYTNFGFDGDDINTFTLSATFHFL